LEYRNLLVKEREIKLKALKRTETSTALPAETRSQPVSQEQDNIDRFNAMLKHATAEKTLRDIALETHQGYVLRALVYLLNMVLLMAYS